MQDSLSSRRNRLNAACKLTRADGFEHVIQAQNITDNLFKVFYARNQATHARLGIIASKKTLPSAVDRNHTKRIIREVFRQHNIKHYKLDLVVMVKRRFPLLADAQTEKLMRLFHQLEIKCADL